MYFDNHIINGERGVQEMKIYDIEKGQQGLKFRKKMRILYLHISLYITDVKMTPEFVRTKEFKRF